MSSDPFAQYRKKVPETEDPFSNYRKKEVSNASQSNEPSEQNSFESENDIDREIERNQAQLTSRFIERVLGTPGDIYQAIPQGIKNINPLNKLHQKLPTSKKIRDFSEKGSLGYTKPKSGTEEKAGEFLWDVASFTIGNPAKGLLGATARSIGIPLSGFLAKEGIEKLGGSEKSQELGKRGTMLLLDLWGLRSGQGGSALEFGKKRLEDARKSIPSKATADVSTFEKTLNRLDKSLGRGITNSST